MNYFNIDCYDELVELYGNDFMMKVNDEFVINAVEKQKKIWFNVDPRIDGNYKGSLKEEWDLINKLNPGKIVDLKKYMEKTIDGKEIEIWKLIVKEI